MKLRRIATLAAALMISSISSACADTPLPFAQSTSPNTPGQHTCGQPGCYWETPMDYTDTAAVWAMLQSPMTVVDGDFRSQVYLYQEPSESSTPIGEITRSTQGLHILETLDNGWTKVETYSSSFLGSRTEAWNKLLVGYVPTNSLKTITVDPEFGLVIDKLTQRLYIYQNGEFLEELAASTGYGTIEEPFNETRSGEFILFSPTGAFASFDMTCNYGLRYNDGDLLHEIPHVKRNGKQDYSRTEGKLGERASHGCLRIQRKRTPQGINMRWIWNNMYKQMGIRLVIWEDFQGRAIPAPAEDTALYYNPKGGKDYHDSPTCYGVLDKYEPLTAFTYGELKDNAYAKLKPCAYCVPPRRIALIEEINAAHALVPDTAEETE